MTTLERVKALGLPLDQLVVIGGGVLDGLQLRPAGDLDLVLSVELFAKLVKLPEWQVGVKHQDLTITQPDIEAFMSWRDDGRPNFQELYDGGLTIDGVRFTHPQVVIDWKKRRASDKDLRDIALLEGYLARG